MDDNPYQSPQFVRRAEPKPGTWHPLAWAIIGFCGATGLVAPFVLSIRVLSQVRGGMIYGGIIGAIWGLAYGNNRKR